MTQHVHNVLLAVSTPPNKNKSVSDDAVKECQDRPMGMEDVNLKFLKNKKVINEIFRL